MDLGKLGPNLSFTVELTVYSAHTIELLALGNALNKNIDYLKYYPSRQHVK